MKKDIILSGVGGQGILSIAAVIGYAAVEMNLHFKQSEVHGMSQRGGAVQSHFRLSDKPVHSDLIAEGYADIIISVEPMESLRYLPWLSEMGWLITNSEPYNNIQDYPSLDAILDEIKKQPKSIIVDADAISRDLGSVKASNMVVLGAASPFLDIDMEKLENAIKTLFGRKGDKVVEMNINALRAGREKANQRSSE